MHNCCPEDILEIRKCGEKESGAVEFEVLAKWSVSPLEPTSWRKLKDLEPKRVKQLLCNLKEKLALKDSRHLLIDCALQRLPQTQPLSTSQEDTVESREERLFGHKKTTKNVQRKKKDQKTQGKRPINLRISEATLRFMTESPSESDCTPTPSAQSVVPMIFKRPNEKAARATPDVSEQIGRAHV